MKSCGCKRRAVRRRARCAQQARGKKREDVAKGAEDVGDGISGRRGRVVGMERGLMVGLRVTGCR